MLSRDLYLNPILNYFMERVGATLAGVKPAELINVSVNGENKRQWEEGKKVLESCYRFKVIQVRERNQKVQVFFLHRGALDRTLQQRPVLLFLKRLHYPTEYSLENYVHTLTQRIKSSHFPHEIGVFLGYPLKDVMGYLGYPGLKLTDIKGWRYYGHGKLSVRTYEKFKEARNKAKLILQKLEKNQAPEEIIKFWDTYSHGEPSGAAFRKT